MVVPDRGRPVMLAKLKPLDRFSSSVHLALYIFQNDFSNCIMKSELMLGQTLQLHRLLDFSYLEPSISMTKLSRDESKFLRMDPFVTALVECQSCHLDIVVSAHMLAVTTFLRTSSVLVLTVRVALTSHVCLLFLSIMDDQQR